MGDAQKRLEEQPNATGGSQVASAPPHLAVRRPTASIPKAYSSAGQEPRGPRGQGGGTASSTRPLTTSGRDRHSQLKIALRPPAQIRARWARGRARMPERIRSTAPSGYLDIKMKKTPERRKQGEAAAAGRIGGSRRHPAVCEELFSAAAAPSSISRVLLFHKCPRRKLWKAIAAAMAIPSRRRSCCTPFPPTTMDLPSATPR